MSRLCPVPRAAIGQQQSRDLLSLFSIEHGLFYANESVELRSASFWNDT